MNATQTKNTLVHPRSGTARAEVTHTPAADAGAPAAEATTDPQSAAPAEPAKPAESAKAAKAASDTAPSAVGARLRDADGMAVASFLLGLVGLLAFNLVLGPCSLVLGGLALLRGTGRRTRALLGIGLGVADLLVLAAVSSADQSFSWSLS